MVIFPAKFSVLKFDSKIKTRGFSIQFRTKYIIAPLLLTFFSIDIGMQTILMPGYYIKADLYFFHTFWWSRFSEWTLDL